MRSNGGRVVSRLPMIWTDRWRYRPQNTWIIKNYIGQYCDNYAIGVKLTISNEKGHGCIDKMKKPLTAQKSHVNAPLRIKGEREFS